MLKRPVADDAIIKALCYCMPFCTSFRTGIILAKRFFGGAFATLRSQYEMLAWGPNEELINARLGVSRESSAPLTMPL